MIPITFNADDVNNEKKGNVRAQDLASILSMGIPYKAGVLDIFDNPCTVYQTSYTTGYAILTLHKGYIYAYGRLIYVEEGEQVQVPLPTDSSTVTGAFGVRISLGDTGANEVTWFTKTGELQLDNLLNNEINGVYEFVLYTYTATSSNIQLRSMTSSKVKNMLDYLNGTSFTTQTATDKTGHIATTKFVHDLLKEYVPQFKQITLNAVVQAESEVISSTVAFKGYGIKYYDYETGKKYWVGNLLGMFRATRAFANVSRFGLGSLSASGITFVKVLDGGVLNIKDSANGYNEDGEGFCSSITDYVYDGATDSISYRPVKTSYAVRNNYYMTMSITNIIMEVQ